jgi:hypothetical protein
LLHCGLRGVSSARWGRDRRSGRQAEGRAEDGALGAAGGWDGMWDASPTMTVTG